MRNYIAVLTDGESESGNSMSYVGKFSVLKWEIIRCPKVGNMTFHPEVGNAVRNPGNVLEKWHQCSTAMVRVVTRIAHWNSLHTMHITTVMWW